MRSDLVVKCRGLPWSCTDRDIMDFFGNASRSIVKIELTRNRDGRASGEAFVVFQNESDYSHALRKDKEHMGKRYIEVFPASPGEIDFPYGGPPDRNARMSIVLPDRFTYIVRLRGLPYACTNEEIIRFFHPLNIAPNGIIIPHDSRSGKTTGDAFVAFYDGESADKALEKNRANIQHRYIEVFPSSHGEMLRTLDMEDMRGGGPWEGGRGPRPSMYDRMGGAYGSRVAYGGMRGGERYDSWDGGYGGDRFDEPYAGRSGGGPMRRGYMGDGSSMGRGGPQYGGRPLLVKMRGLPYRATGRDVMDFFYPLRPVNVEILSEFGTGRPSGEAVAEFLSPEERNEALRRDRKNMGSRYIELFVED